MSKKTWKEKVGKRLMKHVAESTQRSTLAEFKTNLSFQKSHGFHCFQCEEVARKLGLQA